MLTALEKLKEHVHFFENSENVYATQEQIVTAMIEYATAACDEQRRICAAEVPIGMPYEQEAEACVLNAPLPTLK